jgi:methylenetetrahydrofolate reductase (NADPH)
MATTNGLRAVGPSPVARLLHAHRYEVIPVADVERLVDVLAPGSTVTVTCSQRHGVDRTLAASERLAARGYVVVPHLAARMIAGREELRRIVRRLGAARISEVFVVGGDASPPVGAFSDAGDLLEELSSLSHPFTRIGVGGYPEGHPLVPRGALFDALRRKQPYAAYVATQLCFDAGALTRWVRSLPAAGIDLPVVVGLPGVVERRKLARISLQTGVGASLRYLRKNGRQLAALARSRRYDPTALACAIAEQAAEQDLRLAGVHLFTFNQVEPTQAWLRRTISL